MKTRFSNIFWGLLLVFLDFSINRFDILPDGLGYLLVAIGCGGLTSLSRRFATARFLSFVLAALWLIGFIPMAGDFAIAFGMITGLIDCGMIWSLLGGIIEFATRCNRPDLASRASNRRLAFVMLVGLGMFLGLASSYTNALAFPLAIMILVAMLIVLAMVLHLIYRVRKELAT